MLDNLAWAAGRKIFGLGFSKTGTSSLCEALRILGFRAVHNPTDDDSMLALLSGNLRCRSIKDNDAICDIMFSRHFRELDRLYPESSFILTERERGAWHASCARHWARRSVRLAQLWNEDLVDFQIYGTAVYRRTLFDDAYNQHYKAVTEYFSGSGRLLRMNICSGDGWDPLCAFLGVSIPGVSFPHVRPADVPSRGVRAVGWHSYPRRPQPEAGDGAAPLASRTKRRAERSEAAVDARG